MNAPDDQDSLIVSKYLFVVGAPKCGTTSLHHYLGQHNRIFVPKRKELHFFSQPEVAETYYKVDLVDSEKAYFECFSEAEDNQILGDFSPSYLAHPNAATRISEKFKNLFIVICLRDPVERAISHYLMDRRMGLIDVELIDVLQAPKQFPQFFREYVRMGMYADDLQKYANIFSREEIRVVTFPAIVEKTQWVVDELIDFIGLDPTANVDLEAKNTYRAPRSNLITSLGKNPVGNHIWKIARKFMPPSFLNSLLYTERKPQLDEERRWLTAHYQDDWNTTKRWLQENQDIVIGLYDE
ncbi:sulfotransferase [Akkermansiaceae bacterium]|nr:sulfotransferase [Akkermansiaceae bacterium]